MLEHKSGNISETRIKTKDKGKFTMGPIGTHQPLSNGTTTVRPSPYGRLLPKIAGSQRPKLQSLLSKGNVTDFKFGWYIHRVHPNKSPLEILDKRECGHIQGLPKFSEYPLLSQEGVKLQTSNFVRTFIGSIATKAH